jgi:hypothetical protein
LKVNSKCASAQVRDAQARLALGKVLHAVRVCAARFHGRRKNFRQFARLFDQLRVAPNATIPEILQPIEALVGLFSCSSELRLKFGPRPTFARRAIIRARELAALRS